MPLITAKDISIGYKGVIVIENLNFSINEGEYYCIVGRNGSGKSTLIKSILGLIPVLSGELKYEDGLKQNEIGYLPQQSSIKKDFPASVWEIVLSGCLNQCGLRPYYKKEEKKIVQKNLERLDISNLSRHSFRNLSGGQQQRVLLARSLCSTKKLLILDEPVAGLDTKATSDLYKLILDLNKNHNITILMISHDIDSAIKDASHILHIDSKSLFCGSKDDYLISEVRRTII